ncbi:hypothetical protein [Tropicimonas sp. IMCC34043]|uniref:hypothetical protein n=1 Tax=Tropicimonas sp. IMCC34043 TaxID=2248760 RepID=UPI000E28385E|nr:hypothetical protein [Tropicimonas sp. IMCC34043]
MTTVILSHAVGNMDTWLKGGDMRKKIFAEFCDSYRVLRHAEADRVALLCEGVDLDRMKAAVSSEAATRSQVEHTVVPPIDVYVLMDGVS